MIFEYLIRRFDVKTGPKATMDPDSLKMSAKLIRNKNK